MDIKIYPNVIFMLIKSLITRKNLCIVSTLTFSCLLVYLICFVLHKLSIGFTGDFYHFYRAAEALRNHLYIYSSGTGGYIYTPFFAFILIPLTYFSDVTACLIWQIINLVLLFFVLWIAFKLAAKLFQFHFNKLQAIGACSLAILLCFNELWWEIKWSQNDLWILAGISLGLWWITTKPFLSGLCFGLVGNIKYVSILFFPLFVLRGRWRVMMGLIIGIIFGLILPVVILGWNANLEYLIIALRGLKNMPGHHTSIVLTQIEARVPDIAWDKNISITSGLTRIFLDMGWPTIFASILASVLLIFLFLILWSIFKKNNVPFIWRPINKYKNKLKEETIFYIECNTLLVALLIFSPQCTMRHLILLLNFHMMAVIIILFPRANVKIWPALTGIFIYQLGKLLNLNHFGGSAWFLLISLPFILYNSLKYCEDLYRDDSIQIKSCSPERGRNR